MANAPAQATGPIRAIDRLRKAANFEPIKQEVSLSNGDEFIFYVTPLTAAEREKAQKDSRGDNAGDFAMQLLVAKALDENGEKLFRSGDIPVLKREIFDEDLQKLILCALRPNNDDEIESDSKSN